MDEAIKNLELRVSAMSKLCADLHGENASLRTHQRDLQKECEQLREKNRIARGRVEQIVARLKDIEQ